MKNLKLWFKVAIRAAALLHITLVAGFMIRIGFEIISSYLGQGVGLAVAICVAIAFCITLVLPEGTTDDQG